MFSHYYSSIDDYYVVCLAITTRRLTTIRRRKRFQLRPVVYSRNQAALLEVQQWTIVAPTGKTKK